MLFQDDIRKFLYNLGAHQRMRAFLRFFTSKRTSEREQATLKKSIMPIVMACMQMSKGKVGALIVLERNMSLDDMQPLRQQVERYLSETNWEEWQSLPDEYDDPDKDDMVKAARRMKADGMSVGNIETHTSLTAEEIESL